MSNPIIVETKLEDVLVKIDSRLERIETKLEALPRLEVEVAQLKEDVKELKSSQRTQIWVLIVAVVSAIIKFGFFPNP
ncbi:MAG: hypothetical protein ACKN9E_02750 [Microcystaceae cyanobacterium]